MSNISGCNYRITVIAVNQLQLHASSRHMGKKDRSETLGSHPVVIDIEASCLPEQGLSYPIEVAVGDLATGAITAWLIRPEPHWMQWDWDPEAERVHRIPQATLVRDGVPRSVVARALVERIIGRRVVSDHPLYDQIWLARLFQGDPGVRIHSLPELCLEIAGHGADADALIERARAHAHAIAPIRHRAAADVAHRLAMLTYLLEQGGRR